MLAEEDATIAVDTRLPYDVVDISANEAESDRHCTEHTLNCLLEGPLKVVRVFRPDVSSHPGVDILACTLSLWDVLRSLWSTRVKFAERKVATIAFQHIYRAK